MGNDTFYYDDPEEQDDDKYDQPDNAGDMTLAEVFGRFIRNPLATYRVLSGYTPVTPEPPPVPESRVINRFSPDVQAETQATTVTRLRDNRALAVLMLYISALMVALWGMNRLFEGSTRTESQLNEGAPFLIVACLMWVGAEVFRMWPLIEQRFGWKDHTETGINSDPYRAEVARPERYDFRWQMLTRIHPARIAAGLGVLIFGLIAWFDLAARTNTGPNEFQPLGGAAWLIAIMLVVFTFAPVTWQPDNLFPRVGGWLRGSRLNWRLVALIGIMLIGGYFRLHQLEAVPPEMTSDHIEKLLDSQRVVEGERDIFFANNGGREPFQMYAMALLMRIPGLDMDFTTLKLLAVIESLVTLPALWWMGREVIGEKNRRLGNVVGLTLALLVAVSYWHVSITRLALRIVLTPLVMALLVGLLSRGMRHNRRGDFLLAGLVLGFGLYTYQAVRMMPLVVLAGVGLAMLFNWRRGQFLRYASNLAVLVAVSFVIFIPLFRFSVDYPELFWMRTAGRLLGDDVIIVIDDQGNRFERNATIGERLDAFESNLPELQNNIRNALLMYHWKGDVAWINGVPNYPLMDQYTGILMIVGLGAWSVLIVRRRDPVYLLIPLALFIMLLPSALAIGAPLENPSATRTSGSLPPAYLLAAFPLALLALTAWDALRGPLRRLVAVGLVVLVAGLAYADNYETYFDDFVASYKQSWISHSLPGEMLRGFAISDGDYGNAFLVGYQHWLDHRIVGLEAGIIDWTNAIADQGGRQAIERIPDFLNDAYRCTGPENRYPLDPTRDLLFFYNQEDEAAAIALKAWFPAGRELLITGEKPRDTFFTYRVPVPGEADFDAWLVENTTSPRCTA